METRHYKNANEPLAEAFRKAGGLRKVAQAIGRKPSTLCEWRRCPAELVLALETLSGVPRYVLRPDVFPNPLAQAGRLACASEAHQ